MGEEEPLAFAEAMKLMRSHDPEEQEAGFYQLQRRAADHLDSLIDAFRAERDHGLKCWLLELVGDARSERAYPLLVAELRNPDPALRDWAIQGLKALDTKESRALLHEAESWELATDDDTADFRQKLAWAKDPRLAEMWVNDVIARRRPT